MADTRRMTPETEIDPTRGPSVPPLPGAVRLTLLVLGALHLSGSAFAIWVAFFGAPITLRFLVGFEAVALVSGVMIVLTGLGRFRQGAAMAVAVSAGCAAAAIGLGFIDARPNLTNSPALQTAFKNSAGLRIGLDALLVIVASLAVFARDRRSVIAIRNALIAGAMTALVGGGAYFLAFDWLTSEQDGIAEPIRIVTLVVGSVVVMALACASIHWAIRAYEHGIPDDQPSGAPGSA